MNVNDKVSMEYEARVMIDEKTYHLFKEAKIKENPSYRCIKNENIYFDNDDLYLTHHHMVLRIRTIDDKNHELTLKIKGENGDIEITSPLGEKEYQSRDISSIKEELDKHNIDISLLHEVSTLVTERIEISHDKYLLVIDKNFYNNKVDYNIEAESSSRKEAEKYLLEETKPFNIEYKKDYVSKSRRAILKL